MKTIAEIITDLEGVEHNVLHYYNEDRGSCCAANSGGKCTCVTGDGIEIVKQAIADLKEHAE